MSEEESDSKAVKKVLEGIICDVYVGD